MMCILGACEIFNLNYGWLQTNPFFHHPIAFLSLPPTVVLRSIGWNTESGKTKGIDTFPRTNAV
jgi:hypothetical protein